MRARVSACSPRSTVGAGAPVASSAQFLPTREPEIGASRDPTSVDVPHVAAPTSPRDARRRRESRAPARLARARGRPATSRRAPHMSTEHPAEDSIVLEELPTAPGVGFKILQLVHQERSSFADLVGVVIADPALTGRLLKTARAGANAVDIASIAQATAILGESGSRRAIEDLSLATRGRIDTCPGFDYERFWSCSLARALAAERVSSLTGIGTPEQAYTLGLLAGIGRLALATLHPVEYSAMLIELGQRDASRLVHAEREQFHNDHEALTSLLFGDWGLPHSFARAAEIFERRERATDAQDPDSLRWTRLLRVAHAIACKCLPPRERAEPVVPDDVLTQTCRALSIDPARVPELQSENEARWKERGAAVGLFAPASAEPRASAQAAPGAPERPAGLRVLAAGNDPTALRLVERLLREQGHTVRCAADGNLALQAALEFEPQVLIADSTMPKLTGVELCAALRRIQSLRKLFFLLLIGRGEEDRVGAAFAAGIDDYVIKPFNPEILLARLHKGQRVLELKERVDADAQTMRGMKTRLGVLARKLDAAHATDPLTGFANRTAIFERLEEEWKCSSASGKPFSIIFVDVDRLGALNDEHGHRAGDQALAHVAILLRNNTRLGEDLARFDGEEFLVLCPNSLASQAAVGGERMRVAIGGRPVAGVSFHGTVTVSIGVAERTSAMKSVDELVKAAHDAVRAAAKAGGDRVQVAGGASPVGSTRGSKSKSA
jgi:diguanylate cyclase (GGDEF)-like protein